MVIKDGLTKLCMSKREFTSVRYYYIENQRKNWKKELSTYIDRSFFLRVSVFVYLLVGDGQGNLSHVKVCKFVSKQSKIGLNSPEAQLLVSILYVCFCLCFFCVCVDGKNRVYLRFPRFLRRICVPPTIQIQSFYPIQEILSCFQQIYSGLAQIFLKFQCFLRSELRRK